MCCWPTWDNENGWEAIQFRSRVSRGLQYARVTQWNLALQSKWNCPVGVTNLKPRSTLGRGPLLLFTRIKRQESHPWLAVLLAVSCFLPTWSWPWRCTRPSTPRAQTHLWPCGVIHFQDGHCGSAAEPQREMWYANHFKSLGKRSLFQRHHLVLWVLGPSARRPLRLTKYSSLGVAQH